MPDGTIAITSLAAGGSGVGRLPDGMTVFVPRTAPGDEVLLGELRRKRRFALAVAADVVRAGPGRVAPPCPHFERDRCGGCQWQHLAMTAQHEAKRRIVGDALRRLGRLDVADPDLVPSPRALGYRATITLTVRRTASRTIAGFHDARDPSRVFALDACLIARDEVAAVWRAVRGRLDALPEGDDVRLKLRLDDDGGLHVIVEGGTRAWTEAGPLLDAVTAAGLEATIWWRPAGGAVRRMAGLAADSGAAAFAQVNPDVARQLREAVLASAAPPGQTARVLDLYAGSGDTALPLAAAGLEVIMVEAEERAVQRAEARARERGVQLRCIAARVEDVLAGLLPADVVIVNPPRTGLAAEVTDVLGGVPPRRLVYVSCDPATLARDLARLAAASFQVMSVRAFDMFPQTSHVETLVVVERAA